MKARSVLFTAYWAACISLSASHSLTASGQQAFAGSISSFGIDGYAALATAPDSGLYADGTRAINEGRWSDAIAIFTNVTKMRSVHSDGALYWKAYAQKRQGQTRQALTTCAELRREFPKSRWIDECGALEIEVSAKGGQPVQPKEEKDANLKLLALNELMRQDEARALAQIQEILKGGNAEWYKERAVFILSQGRSEQARELLTQAAQDHANPGLQAKAEELLTGFNTKKSNDTGKATRAMTLDVVVTDKLGAPVSGLKPEDFKLLDNGQPQSIASFREASGTSGVANPPVEVILLVDAVNAPVPMVANERQWLAKFFLENGGELALPTSIVVFTEDGLMAHPRPSRDGKELKSLLDGTFVGRRPVGKAAGYWGYFERAQLSIQALNRIASTSTRRPGRKLLIWISPGWAESYQTLWAPTEQRRLFNQIVAMSAALREAQITLCSIDPGGAESRDFIDREYLKGVDKPSKVDYADLMLQVLATQSGGSVQFGNNDLTSLIDRCVAEAKAYYILTFSAPAAGRPNEYHSIQVQVGKPGLTARTRTGYYAQP
jgi:VWFA-related protein